MGRHKREENNIKMDVEKVGWCGLNLSDLPYSPMLETCEQFDELSFFIKLGKFIEKLPEKESFCII
jgi:hypothetical protein